MSFGRKSANKSEDKVAFTKDVENVIWFNCRELGHYKGSVECSKTTKSATSILMTVRLEDGSNSDGIG